MRNHSKQKKLKTVKNKKVNNPTAAKNSCVCHPCEPDRQGRALYKLSLFLFIVLIADMDVYDAFVCVADEIKCVGRASLSFHVYYPRMVIRERVLPFDKKGVGPRKWQLRV